MKRLVKTALLAMIGLLLISIQAMADITTETLTGSAVKGVISLFEPEGSTNFVGTLEWIGAGSNGVLQRKDVNGVVINQSLAFSNIVGTMKPIYDNQGKILSFRCFTGNTQKMGVVNYGADLFYKGVKSSWPATPVPGEIYYPDASIRNADGTSLNFSYNTKGVYTMITDANDQPVAQMKTLDLSGLGLTAPSIAGISVTQNGGDIILAVSCAQRNENNNFVNIDIAIFNLNGEGERNQAPVKFDYGGLFGEDMIGDIVSQNGKIYVLGNSYSTINRSYLLRLDENLLYDANDIFAFDVNSRIYDAAINPDGLIYVAGTKTGDNYDSMIGWINALNPSQFEFNYLDLGNKDFLQTIDWIPDGAIAGGSIDFTSAIRVVYTKDKDTDGDGIIDEKDQCADTPLGSAVDASGCAVSQKDTDQDGVFDDKDKCIDTPLGSTVDVNGCSDSQKDTDQDGVFDDKDLCADTPIGSGADANGCAISQIDTDQDGVFDDKDNCPGTVPGECIDEYGCSHLQKDEIIDSQIETISSMFTKEQLEEAVKVAVEVERQKWAKQIGIQDAIKALKIVTGQPKP